MDTEKQEKQQELKTLRSDKQYATWYNVYYICWIVFMLINAAIGVMNNFNIDIIVGDSIFRGVFVFVLPVSVLLLISAIQFLRIGKRLKAERWSSVFTTSAVLASLLFVLLAGVTVWQFVAFKDYTYTRHDHTLENNESVIVLTVDDNDVGYLYHYVYKPYGIFAKEIAHTVGDDERYEIAYDAEKDSYKIMGYMVINGEDIPRTIEFTLD